MAYQDDLNQTGSLGRFQSFQMTFLLICNAVVLLHAVLESLIAAIPCHCCWVTILDIDTVFDNDSGKLSQDDFLRISPDPTTDSNLRPDKCPCFVQPQWHHLHPNGTFSRVTKLDIDLYVCGWVYDQSTFFSTMVFEVSDSISPQELGVRDGKNSTFSFVLSLHAFS